MARRPPVAPRPRTATADDDPHPQAHAAGEAAGKVIGGGLGLVIGFGGLLLLFGPVLWAPLWAAASAGLRVQAATQNPWLTAGAAIGAALAVGFVQFWLLVQKRPLLRYPAVLLFSLAWVGGLWLQLTAPPHPWLVPPAWHTPGTWAMVAIGTGTVLYAGLYLLLLTRFGKGRWTRRWQLLK